MMKANNQLGFINIKIGSISISNIVGGVENSISMNELNSYVSSYSYDVEIRAIDKNPDDSDDVIRKY